MLRHRVSSTQSHSPGPLPGFIHPVYWFVLGSQSLLNPQDHPRYLPPYLIDWTRPGPGGYWRVSRERRPSPITPASLALPVLEFVCLWWQTSEKENRKKLIHELSLKKPGDFTVAFSMAEPACGSWWRPSVTELRSVIEGRPGPARQSRTLGFSPTGLAVGGAGPGPSQKADRV